jgi:hypothetical protein
MAESKSKGKSPTYLLVSEKVGAPAIEWLRQLRPDWSWRMISLELYRRHGLDVTEVTLRKWWADAQEQEEAQPAAQT